MTEELSVVEWNDDNKLLALYRAGMDNPDQKSNDEKYTNAELALRIDLGKKRLVYTGNFWLDLKYMLWNNHAVLSLVRTNYLDPFTRKGRLIVLIVTMAITAASSIGIAGLGQPSAGDEDPYATCTGGHDIRPGFTSGHRCYAMSGCCYGGADDHCEECIEDPRLSLDQCTGEHAGRAGATSEDRCLAMSGCCYNSAATRADGTDFCWTCDSPPDSCADDAACFWFAVPATAVAVFFFNFMCRFLWVCQCAQGGNQRVRCLAEKTGSLIVVSIGVISVITVVTLAAIHGTGKQFFVTFLTQTIMSWFQDIFISSFVFWCRAYPKEMGAVQKAFDEVDEGKKEFNTSFLELEARGMEVKTDLDVSLCSTRAKIASGLFFLRGDQDDYTIGAIKDDAQIETQIEMGESAAGNSTTL